MPTFHRHKGDCLHFLQQRRATVTDVLEKASIDWNLWYKDRRIFELYNLIVGFACELTGSFAIGLC